MDDSAKALAASIAKIFGLTEGQFDAMIEQRRQQEKDRIRRANALYQNALLRITPIQTDLIVALEAKGYKLNKVWESRRTHLTAVMMVKRDAWNSAKGRMGRKLVMVYPDASVSETFEVSISIKPF